MSLLPTKQQLAKWWRDPSLVWYKQHPIAHAAGGGVFLTIAAALFCIVAAAFDYHSGCLGLAGLLTLILGGVAAYPIVKDENQNRSLQLGVIKWSLTVLWVGGIALSFVLPETWRPWLLATMTQGSWELLQRSAWVDPITGKSTYPWYSVILDAGTASLVAALLTGLYLLVR